MKLFTIGFTKSSAEHFFGRIAVAGVKSVLDTRLNSHGQLSGFAKDADLEFFLSRLTAARYRSAPILAPTPDMLKKYRDKELSWEQYEKQYLALLESRHSEILDLVPSLDGACLLCSESTAEKCHRRIAARYIVALSREAFEIIDL